MESGRIDGQVEAVEIFCMIFEYRLCMLCCLFVKAKILFTLTHRSVFYCTFLFKLLTCYYYLLVTIDEIYIYIYINFITKLIKRRWATDNQGKDNR